MAIAIHPFRVEDLHLFDIRPKFQHLLEFDPDQLRSAFEAPYSWTAWADGKPILCAGIVMETAEAWAIPASKLGREHLAASAAVQEHGLKPFNVYEGLPVIARVDQSDPIAIRWLRLLGFRHTHGEHWKYDAALT